MDKYIYFVLAIGTNALKIGIASNLKKRIEAIRTNCPNKIILFSAIKVPPCYFAKEWEKMCLERFKDSNIHGEWFYLSDELIEFMEIVKDRRISNFMKYFEIENHQNYFEISELPIRN